MGLASVCPGLDPNTPPQIEGRPLKCILVEGIDGCIKKPPGVEGKSYHLLTGFLLCHVLSLLGSISYLGSQRYVQVSTHADQALVFLIVRVIPSPIDHGVLIHCLLVCLLAASPVLRLQQCLGSCLVRFMPGILL